MPEILAPTKPQPKPRQVLAYDNRDCRGEIETLLNRLHPAQRLRFLEWACAQTYLPNSYLRPEVEAGTRALARLAETDDSASARLTWVVFFDLFRLAGEWSMDLDAVVRQLEQVVRRI